MKKSLRVLCAVFVFLSLKASATIAGNPKDTDAFKFSQCLCHADSKAEEYPLWSGYIIDFYHDDRCYITYKEDWSYRKVLYCTESVYKSLKKDWEFMIKLALQVKAGIYTYDFLVLMESVFQEKYTYSKRSNNEWWITQH